MVVIDALVLIIFTIYIPSLISPLKTWVGGLPKLWRALFIICALWIREARSREHGLRALNMKLYEPFAAFQVAFSPWVVYLFFLLWIWKIKNGLCLVVNWLRFNKKYKMFAGMFKLAYNCWLFTDHDAMNSCLY